MKIIEIKQGTDSWLLMRKKIIGSSDVAAITGTSPHLTALMLYQNKISPDLKQVENFIFEKGHYLEEIARALYEIKTNNDFPASVVRHDDLVWCQASLDGLSTRLKEQIEIKYMGKAMIENLKKGIVPPYYYDQIQYQLLATSYMYAWLVAIDDDKKIYAHKVYRNNERIDFIKLKCEEFYNAILNNKPPKPTDMDSLEIDDIELKNALLRLRELEAILTPALKEKEQLTALLKEKLTHPKMNHDGINTTLSVTKNGTKSLRVTFK